MRDGAAFDAQFRRDSLLVRRIDCQARDLTGPERDLVEQCVEYLDAHKCLTDEMRGKAERIAEERCP